MMFRDMREEANEISFVMKAALSTFKRNEYRGNQYQQKTGQIPYHNVTTRRIRAIKRLSWAMDFNFTVHNSHCSIWHRRMKERVNIFATPQEAAAWLLAEYQQRKEASSGPEPERV